MSELYDILNGIYGQYHLPVIVYESSGQAIWNNKAAKALEEESPDAFVNIITQIVMNGETSGRIKNIIYHRAAISGSYYTIAVIDNETTLEKLFSDSKVSGYSYQAESLTRRSVANISVACSYISDAAAEENFKEIGQSLDVIMKECCRLLKNVTLGSQLSAAAVSSNVKSSYINFGVFMKKIADGCSKAMDDNFKIECSCGCDAVIKANSVLLTYFILLIIRAVISAAGKDCDHINITSETDEKQVKLLIDSGSNADSGFVNGTETDILNVFADKLDAKYSFFCGKAEILMPLADNSNMLLFESDKLCLGEEVFSPFSIILGDTDKGDSFF